ncbi:ChaN family lipoprotein [Larkinella humicola]|uniref:ChaN family lipoprotein n=1 Tax=Larkinella humicola TaxID=2607654 RepID=A0A5N1J706_9BACT|nr:ChaN family lipoprotein [Larkinella humicola]KAA9346502.1 ChaN family lipoprotein [Larkinella humicola]
MRYLLLFLLPCFAFTSDKPAYQFYNQKLKTTSYQKVLKEAAGADVVFFGELHNNPICHWLELQLTKDLYEQRKEHLILGAEMFEADNQTALSDYVSGKTTDKEFPKQARLWNNYKTDYRPLVDFAREHKLSVVATNVPRRYASAVARHGLASLDTVPTAQKAWMAPLPLTVDLTLPGYKAMLDMMHGDAVSPSASKGPSDQAANFARAQAIKDATMAHFILQNRKPGSTFLHFNGSYHSNNFEGIIWYLRQKQPDLKIVTIASVEVPDVAKPDKANQNLASFILHIPADMTKTY